MRTAVIADIHGHHGALLAVLADIAAAGCDRIVCLGDVVEGGDGSAACVRELMSRGIAIVRGNHDELHAQLHRTPDAQWLGALPAAITEGEVVYTHISPRNDDRAIKDRYTAWSVLDDTTQRIAFVGHAHIPAVYGWRGAAVGAARQVPIEYGRPIPLDPDDRYIICSGSVARGRDGDPLPRYAIFDDAARTVEIRRV